HRLSGEQRRGMHRPRTRLLHIVPQRVHVADLAAGTRLLAIQVWVHAALGLEGARHARGQARGVLAEEVCHDHDWCDEAGWAQWPVEERAEVVRELRGLAAVD